MNKPPFFRVSFTLSLLAYSIRVDAQRSVAARKAGDIPLADALGLRAMNNRVDLGKVIDHNLLRVGIRARDKRSVVAA